jgi:hypothetical protein
MQKLNQFKINLPFEIFQLGTIRGLKLIEKLIQLIVIDRSIGGVG